MSSGADIVTVGSLSGTSGLWTQCGWRQVKLVENIRQKINNKNAVFLLVLIDTCDSFLIKVDIG